MKNPLARNDWTQQYIIHRSFREIIQSETHIYKHYPNEYLLTICMNKLGHLVW